MMVRMPSRLLEGLLYALMAFGPLAFGSVEPWSRATLETLAFLLALGCFLRGRPALTTAADSMWLFPAGFAAFGAVQLLSAAAPDGPRPLAPFTAAPHETENAVLLWAAYAAVLWSVPRVLVAHDAARRCARVLFGLGLAVAAQGMLQDATTPGKLYWLREAPRAYSFGPYYNRDHAANLLLMCLAIGLGILFSRPRKAPGADGLPRESILRLALAAAAVAVLLAGVFACASRGALLAIPLAGMTVALCGASFANRSRSRRARAAAALAGAAIVVFLAFRLVGEGANAGALVDRSVTARFYIYGDSWRWLKDTPVFGTGLGSFETVYPSYQDRELRGVVRHAHSDWLELALETGLFGLLAALTAAAWTAAAAVRSWKEARSSEMRALIGGGFAAAAAFLAHSLFEFSFQIPGNAVVFFVVAGFILSSSAWRDKVAPTARPAPPPLWASLAAAACFLGLTGAVAFAATGRSLEPDPKRLTSSAAYLYMGAVQGGGVDHDATRGAMNYALAAASLRPFDADTLLLAAGSLRRLGRAADAEDFFNRAGMVRFAALTRAQAPAPSMENKIDSLRGVGLLPSRLEPK